MKKLVAFLICFLSISLFTFSQVTTTPAASTPPDTTTPVTTTTSITTTTTTTPPDTIPQAKTTTTTTTTTTTIATPTPALSSSREETGSFKALLGGSLKLDNKELFNSYAIDICYKNRKLFNLKKNDGKKPYGISVGLYYYTYKVTDSTERYSSYTRFQKPYDTRIVGQTPLVRDNYVSNSSLVFENLGVYVDITFHPDYLENENVNLGFSLHGELVRNGSRYEVNRSLIRSDTSIYTKDDSVRNSNRRFISDIQIPAPNKLFSSRYNGYFGIGLPFEVEDPNLVSLSLHPIIGFTSFNPSDYPSYSALNYTSDFFPFYLIKAQVTEKISKVNLTIGFESRGIYGRLDQPNSRDNGKLIFFQPSVVIFLASKLSF